MSVIGSNILAGAAGQGGGYVIDNSLRFRSSASAYLNRTPATAGNRKTWTWSGWVKRGKLGVRQAIFVSTNAAGTAFWAIEFTSTDTVNVYDNQTGLSQANTSAVYRDPSAWYHIVVCMDTTNATALDRFRLYVNGLRVAAWTASPGAITLNANSYVNQALPHNIGSWTPATTAYLDGYLTEVNFIDGQALTPSSFGDYNEDTGVWQPAKYAGSYGTNGFYLNFSDNTTTTTLAADSSGNGNDWTPNNISLTSGATYDSMTDTPTPYADGGNYCVVNPLLKGGNLTIAAANLNINSTGAWTTAYGTFLIPTTGKWYWEVTAGGGNTNPGIASADSNLAGNLSTYPSDTLVSYTYYGLSGNKLTGPGNASAAYGASFTTNDVIGIAFDANAGTLTFYKNNTSQGTAFSSLTAQYVPVFGVYDSGVQSANFGQRPFAYTPPAGFKSLHTGNLPDSAIENGSEYFAAVLRNGYGASGGTLDCGFQPDFVWEKPRNSASFHTLWDSNRGLPKSLYTNSTDAETNSTWLTGFVSNGLTFGTNDYGSGSTLVDWVWKAGGAAVTNTAGSITSQVSASPTAGFSVVTYTGNGTQPSTVGHGLGVAPSMVIVKTRDSASYDWNSYHVSLGNTQYIALNTTVAASSAVSLWNNTSPTSTVFSLNHVAVNTSSNTYVAYCFAEVEGYSKFGSYTGNGSSDGTFVYLGHRPRFLLIKSTTAGTEWVMIDTERSQYNLSDTSLYANRNYSEATIAAVNDVDILSNGFKLRNNTGFVNAAQTYIYMAFAENPFKNSLAR